MSTRGSETLAVRAVHALRNDPRSPAAASKSRIVARLEASIAGLSATEFAAPSSSADASSEAPRTAPSRAAPANALARAGRLAAPALSRTAAVALTAFAAGGVVGAGVYATVLRPTPKIVYVDQPSFSPPRSEPVAVALPERNTPPVASDSAPSPRVPSKPSMRAPIAMPSTSFEASTPSLAEQQALLDKARAALGRGQNDAVLDVLTQHAHRYPDSALAEEREAIAIKALIGARRFAEARQRGAAFRQRFPNSLLLPSVDEALGRIP